MTDGESGVTASLATNSSGSRLRPEGETSRHRTHLERDPRLSGAKDRLIWINEPGARAPKSVIVAMRNAGENAAIAGHESFRTGELVVHLNFAVLGLILTLCSVSIVQAQGTIDVSKITCDQFVHSKVGNPRTIAAWLSGFYNGKRDNRVIDLQNYEADLRKLEKFCYEEKNFRLPVMQAIEKVIVDGK
jgi:hypothetical protein